MIVAWTVDRKHFADRAAPPPLPKVMPVFGLCNLLSERNAMSPHLKFWEYFRCFCIEMTRERERERERKREKKRDRERERERERWSNGRDGRKGERNSGQNQPKATKLGCVSGIQVRE